MTDKITIIICVILFFIFLPLTFSAVFNYQLGKISKTFRKFACYMGWHSSPNFDNVKPAPKDPLAFSILAECQWCKYKGQIDSQGNLF